jgi:predicted nucleic acid-binding protein
MGSGFVFTGVPLPANNDAATAARFTLVDGTADGHGGGLAVLHDGLAPSVEDQPAKNFFFQAGTDGGRIQIDLGRRVPVKQVCSYSWHGGPRGPQVYSLYAATGEAGGFKPEPKRGVDLVTCGWQVVARVDTRPKDGEGAGQYGVALTSDTGLIGTFRYLLFDLSATEHSDPFGNTFYSEIDVTEANGETPTSDAALLNRPVQKVFVSDDGRYRFTLDVTAAPDLTAWAEKELKAVVLEWYPKLVSLLPSEGYRAPTEILLRFREDMGGTPASASGGGINLNAVWLRRELQREALGAVVHEMVHVVQNYGRARRTNPTPASTPGWVVEGIADYVRWFLYEPQTHGAEITKRNLAGTQYDASYRISANFLNWVALTYDKQLVCKLNAAAREGRYDESLWKRETGKPLRELADEWRLAQERRLGGT